MKPHILPCTAATLLLRVRRVGNLDSGPPPDFRIWEARGGPAFMYLDPAGNTVAGYEYADAHGRTVCAVYRGMAWRPDAGGVTPVARRVVRDLCPDCGRFSDVGDDSTVCAECRAATRPRHVIVDEIGEIVGFEELE